jgi:hypothetical protein
MDLHEKKGDTTELLMHYQKLVKLQPELINTKEKL